MKLSTLPSCLPAAIALSGSALFAILPIAAQAEDAPLTDERRVPDWALDAVWYQLFPERFRDGDKSNNPTRNSLVWPIRASEEWSIMPWGSDWYARQPWELEMDKGSALRKVDRFYNNGVLDRRYGGDLQGILDQLDYLADLGINVLYLNPIFYARSLHKYDGNTFHHVDPYFGPDPQGDFAIMDKETADPATWQWTSADKLFLKLIQEAKARNIRIVLDGVWNHTGRDFFAFLDLRRNQEKSPYKDWYRVSSFDDQNTARNEFEYYGWWGYKGLPVFAATEGGKNMHPGPKDYVFAATRRWMDPNGDGDPSDGIDGWRLDVADELPPEFWADWHVLVRELNPDAYTSAEVWSNPLELIEYGGFSAAMNYHGFAIPVKGFLIDRHIPASRFATMMDERRKALPGRIAPAMMNLIDSHDTDRVASMAVNGELIEYNDPNHIAYNADANPRRSETYLVRKPNERERAIQKLVTILQMTYVGAPMIYYGTESGMWGGTDPDVRKPMVWADIEYDAEKTDPRGNERTPDEVAFDTGIHAFYRSAIAVRNGHPVLRHGDFQILDASDEKQSFAFERSDKDATIITAFNRSDEPQTLQFALSERAASHLADELQVLIETSLGNHETQFSLKSNQLTIRLPALASAVLGLKPAPAQQE